MKSEQPESLEEQAAQEGYVPEQAELASEGEAFPEYEPDEDPPEEEWDPGPEVDDEGGMSDYRYDMSDPYDIEYDVP